MASVFEFVETLNKFIVMGRGDPITVGLNKSRTGIYVITKVAEDTGLIGLYDYYHLAHIVSANILNQRGVQKIPSKLRKPFELRIGRALGHRFYVCWQHLLYQTPLIVRNVQRALFSSSIGSKSLNAAFFDGEIYKNTLFCEDIINNRAVAIMAANVHTDIDEAQENWLSWYTDADAYPALLETLEHLPGGIPEHELRYLRYIKLTKPIKSRLRMLILLQFIDHYPGFDGEVDLPPEAISNLKLIEQCTDKEFNEAVDKVLVFTNLKRKDLRKIKNTRTIANSFAEMKLAASSITELADWASNIVTQPAQLHIISPPVVRSLSLALLTTTAP